MSLKIILLFLIFSFVILLTACSSKQIVYKDKLVCNIQELIPQPKAKIRIYKDDIDLARNYKNALLESFRFYEEQVKSNNKICKDIK